MNPGGRYMQICPIVGSDPYAAPQQCTIIDTQTGAMMAASTQRAGLQGPPMRPPSFAPPPRSVYSSPRYAPHGDIGIGGPVGIGGPFGPIDSPIVQVYGRGPSGPWERVGYVYTDSDKAKPEEKTMKLYARQRDYSRNRFDYRVVDSNAVPIDIDRNKKWLDSGDTVHVTGYGQYTVKIYDNFSW